MINIRSEDILWRFYCKRFVIEGEEVEPPKNFCSYFRTAMKGFILWFTKEVNLSKLWLLALLAFVLLSAAVKIFPHPSQSHIFVKVLVFTLWIIYILMVVSVGGVTLIRVFRTVEARAPWVMYLITFCFFGSLIVHETVHGRLWIITQKFFREMIQWLAYGMIAVVGICITIFLFALIVPFVPYGTFHCHSQRMQRVFTAVVTYVKAKKKRVCPLVNPPKEFKIR